MRRLIGPIVSSLFLLVACNDTAPQTSSTGGSGTTTGSGTTSGSGTSGTTGSNSTGTTGGSSSGTSSTGGTGGTSGNDAGVATGAPCTPGANPDPCFAQGLACDATATCQYPAEINLCLPSVGCAAGLQCTSGYQQGTTPVSICLHTCTTTSDCPNPITSCQTHNGGQVCFLNYCGPGSGNGSAFFQPCNSAGTNDGLCTPYGNGGGGEYGFCTAGGALAVWSLCTGTRSDGGTSGLCDLQGSCLPFNGATGPTAYLCTPLCGSNNTAGTGPSCASGDTCFPTVFDFGFCLQDCGPDAGACPPAISCNSIQGSNGPAQECLP